MCLIDALLDVRDMSVRAHWQMLFVKAKTLRAYRVTAVTYFFISQRVDSIYVHDGIGEGGRGGGVVWCI